MDWHEIFRLNQAKHEFLLLLATVSRGVDIVNLTVDDFDTSFRNDVNQLVDASGVSRDWARREDNGIAGVGVAPDGGFR